MSQGFLTVAQPCPKCHGGGTGQQARRARPCRGEGRQRAEHMLQVKIPAGIEDGMQLRLSGEGGGGVQGGPAGRSLRARPDRGARALRAARRRPLLRHSRHLRQPGARRRGRGADPRRHDQSSTIPAGTQPNDVLRLRGKGMPHLRQRRHGDTCYRLVLEVPQKLNAKQREALAAFEAASKDERGPLASAFFERMKKLLG